MNHLSLPQRKQILEFYIKNDGSVKQTFRDLRPIYGRNNRSTERTIRDLIKKFDETISLCDNVPTNCARRVRTDSTIPVVKESVTEDRKVSIRRRAQELDLCASTLWKVLRKDLGLRAYKVQ